MNHHIGVLIIHKKNQSFFLLFALKRRKYALDGASLRKNASVWRNIVLEIWNESAVQKERFRVAANKLLNHCFLLWKREDTKKE